MYHRRCSPAPFSGCFVHPLHYLLAKKHAFGAEIATRDFAICITLLFSGCFVHPLHYLLAENHAFGATIATRIFAIYIPLHPFGVLGREFLHLQCAILHVEVHESHFGILPILGHLLVFHSWASAISWILPFQADFYPYMTFWPKCCAQQISLN